MSHGFPLQLISLIMSCISTTSFFVIINGKASTSLKSSKGVRQGCLLSPYLLLLCTNILSQQVLQHRDIKGIKVHFATPEIAHLIFVDDHIFFLYASPANIRNFKQVLYQYIVLSSRNIDLQNHLYNLARPL